MTRTISGMLIAASLTIVIPGCTGQLVQTATGPMPDYCVSGTPNVASGAIIGTLLGAALGAAAGGGRGAALGAGLGAAAGGLTGAQMDANCRQFAMQNFMQMMTQQAAAERAAMAHGRLAALQPNQYQNFDYYAPAAQNGQPSVHHQIRQTSHYTDPATHASCSGFSELSFGGDGKSSISTGAGRVCVGVDGKAYQA